MTKCLNGPSRKVTPYRNLSGKGSLLWHLFDELFKKITIYNGNGVEPTIKIKRLKLR
jgi:hypothetical protein